MVYAVLLTGGTGSRMGSGLPKQFIEINNKPLFIYPSLTLANNQHVDHLLIVINPEYKDKYLYYINKFNLTDVSLIEGGSTRYLSVSNALNFLKDKAKKNDIILIHDGARALLSDKIIDENIKQSEFNPSITVTKVFDTIVKKDYTLLNRDNLLTVQTPQTFKYEDILKLHSNNDDINSSDDGQLAKKYGFKISYVEGSKLNFKVTTPDDLELLKAYLER